MDLRSTVIILSAAALLHSCRFAGIQQEEDSDRVEAEHTKDPWDIADRDWYFLAIDEGDTIMPFNGERPWVRFSSDGFKAFTGCNNLIGSALLGHGTILLGEIAATKKFCADHEALESRILTSLATANIYSIENDDLVLWHDERILATLRAAAVP